MDHPDPSPGDARHTTASATPRWVKIFAAITVVVAILFVVVLLFGGDHGPGRHAPIPGSIELVAPRP